MFLAICGVAPSAGSAKQQVKPHPDLRRENEGDLFSRLRTPGVGEQLVLQENFFVEQVLPAGMNRRLTPAEHDAYREPFRSPRDRRPVLRWIQQIPVGGDPAEVDAVNVLDEGMNGFISDVDDPALEAAYEIDPEPER